MHHLALQCVDSLSICGLMSLFIFIYIGASMARIAMPQRANQSSLLHLTAPSLHGRCKLVRARTLHTSLRTRAVASKRLLLLSTGNIALGAINVEIDLTTILNAILGARALTIPYA